jgi:hypothetical protein
MLERQQGPDRDETRKLPIDRKACAWVEMQEEGNPRNYKKS